MMLSILSCVCWQSIYLLWRNVYLGLLPIFGLGCLFFWYWAAWAACKFSRLILCQLLHLQIFSLILRAVFSSWANSSLMIKWKCKFRENKSGYLEDNMHSEAIHVIVVSWGKGLCFACKQNVISNYSNQHLTGTFMKIEVDPEEWARTGVFILENGWGLQLLVALIKRILEWLNPTLLATEPG